MKENHTNIGGQNHCSVANLTSFLTFQEFNTSTFSSILQHHHVIKQNEQTMTNEDTKKKTNTNQV